MDKANKISLPWSISANGKSRTAKDPMGAVLRVDEIGGRWNRRFVWSIWLVDGDEKVMMAEGEVPAGDFGAGRTRYASFERESMFRAEQRARLEGWIS